jgi:hypothetical protein
MGLIGVSNMKDGLIQRGMGICGGMWGMWDM